MVHESDSPRVNFDLEARNPKELGHYRHRRAEANGAIGSWVHFPEPVVVTVLAAVLTSSISVDSGMGCGVCVQ